MLVSKDGEIIQYGSGPGSGPVSGKSHWPFRGWIQVTGCCGTLRCQPECPIQTAAPIQGYTWHEGYAKKWETTYHQRQSGSFNSPGEFEESSHHCPQHTYALFWISWQAGVCTDHQEPATCFPVEIPKSCPEASPTIGLIDDQSCIWLTIGTEWFWQISAGPHLSSLGRMFSCDHDIGTQYATYKGELIHLYIKWYNRLIYEPINPRAVAPQRQYSERLLLSLYIHYGMTQKCDTISASILFYIGVYLLCFRDVGTQSDYRRLPESTR